MDYIVELSSKGVAFSTGARIPILSRKYMGAVTVKYYQGGTKIDEPTNVGTYTVKIDVAQGGNYAAATGITDSACRARKTTA